MALPGFNLEIVLSLSRAALDAYFNEFARFIPDAPDAGPKYGIRVGSHGMYDNDTAVLKTKMIAYLAKERRKRTRASGTKRKVKCSK